MRRAAKIDANQPAIVERLRHHGYSVWPTHALGKGFPDLVVAKSGLTWLLEVKDGDKPPSARKLTDDEREFHIKWQGVVLTVISPNDALSQLDGLLRGR